MHIALLYFFGDSCNGFSTSFYSFYSTSFKYVYKTFLYYRNIHTFFNYHVYQFFAYYVQDFSLFHAWLGFFLVFALLLCLCVNVSHVFYLFTKLMIIIHQHVLLFFIFMLILTKMLIAFKVTITPLQKIFGYFYQPPFYF